MYARVSALALLGLAFGACHVTTRHELTRPGSVERVSQKDAPTARRPTLVFTAAGTLRVVEPLECQVEELLNQQRVIEIERKPNLATFVVGVLATAVGGVVLGRGVGDDDASNPSTYVGVVAIAVGVPLMIGPWIGNGIEVKPGDAPAPLRRPGRSEPCGERMFAARYATLTARGIEVFASVDGEGELAVSPYHFIDAFAQPITEPWGLSGTIDAANGERTVDLSLDGRTLTERAAKFLARSGIDATIGPMRIVPNVVPGTLRVSLTSTPAGAAARIALAVKNDGPGPAYALRGIVASPGTPAIDGRILYFGHVANGGALTREILIPLAPAAADRLRNATIDLALELRDAHGTAPTTPVRFRGPVLVDAPR